MGCPTGTALLLLAGPSSVASAAGLCVKIASRSPRQEFRFLSGPFSSEVDGSCSESWWNRRPQVRVAWRYFVKLATPATLTRPRQSDPRPRSSATDSRSMPPIALTRSQPFPGRSPSDHGNDARDSGTNRRTAPGRCSSGVDRQPRSRRTDLANNSASPSGTGPSQPPPCRSMSGRRKP
jgi:hypothetical protein